MSMLKKELLIFQDKLYYIYRRIAMDIVNDNIIKGLKDELGCDKVIKNKEVNQNIMLFLKEIPELEIIE